MKKKTLKARNANELHQQVVALYDDLSELSDQCSSLCDAFSAIPAQDDYIASETISGMGIYSRWLKGRVLEVKDGLHKIHQLLKSFDQK